LFAAALSDDRHELASLPVATAEIAELAQRRIRGRRPSRPQHGRPSGEQRRKSL